MLYFIARVLLIGDGVLLASQCAAGDVRETIMDSLLRSSWDLTQVWRFGWAACEGNDRQITVRVIVATTLLLLQIKFAILVLPLHTH